MRKTFEELVDEIGLNKVFEGTNADETIKQLMLDWLFDYRLCSDSDNTFLRYFRRRFNNLYPRYLEQVRILSVKSNFDPFVTQYFQELVDNLENENSNRSVTGEKLNNSVTSFAKGTTSTTVRTPDLRNDHTDNTIGSENSEYDENYQDGKHSYGDEYNYHTGSDTAVKTGSQTHTKSGNDNTEHMGDDTVERRGTDTTSFNGKTTSDANSVNDNLAIQYPEANLGSIPANLSALDNLDSSRSLAYVNSETIGLGKSHSESGYEDRTDEVEHNTDDKTKYNSNQKTTYNTTDTDTYNSVTDRVTKGTTDHLNRGLYDDADGSKNSTNNVSKQENRSGYDTQTGTETTQTTNSGNDTNTVNGSDSETTLEDIERNKNGKEQREHKGRTESVADIVPRAIKAIVNTNELMWFIDSMKVCFDCTSFM